MRTAALNVAVTWLLLIAPCSAHAYIGPGLGLGTIAVVLGVVISLFLGLFAILWYPLKRLIKKIQTTVGGKTADKDFRET
jgi:hypothetical protein